MKLIFPTAKESRQVLPCSRNKTFLHFYFNFILKDFNVWSDLSFEVLPLVFEPIRHISSLSCCRKITLLQHFKECCSKVSIERFILYRLLLIRVNSTKSTVLTPLFELLNKTFYCLIYFLTNHHCYQRCLFVGIPNPTKKSRSRELKSRDFKINSDPWDFRLRIFSGFYNPYHGSAWAMPWYSWYWWVPGTGQIKNSGCRPAKKLLGTDWYRVPSKLQFMQVVYTMDNHQMSVFHI